MLQRTRKDVGSNKPLYKHAEAVGFCTWATNESGVVFRIPTEDEWAFCCFAGFADLLDERARLLEGPRLRVPRQNRLVRHDAPPLGVRIAPS